MIGTSLSACIADIINGHILEQDCEKIIARTCAPDNARWAKVMESYAKTFWFRFPQEAVTLATKMRDDGKIYQPRVDDMPIPVGCEFWVETEDQIQWSRPRNDVKVNTDE